MWMGSLREGEETWEGRVGEGRGGVGRGGVGRERYMNELADHPEVGLSLVRLLEERCLVEGLRDLPDSGTQSFGEVKRAVRMEPQQNDGARQLCPPDQETKKPRQVTES